MFTPRAHTKIHVFSNDIGFTNIDHSRSVHFNYCVCVARQFLVSLDSAPLNLLQLNFKFVQRKYSLFSYLSCIFNWNELSNSFYITAYCTEMSKPRIYFYWYIVRIGWFAGVCYSIKQYAKEKNSNNKFTWVFNANKMFSQGTVDNFLYCQLKPIFMLNSHAPKPIFVVVNFDFFYSFFFTTTRFFLSTLLY